MAITMEQAQELVESVFDFDHVGDAMFAIRKDLTAPEPQAHLTAELTRCAAEEAGDSSAETLAVLGAAAKERVDRFVAGSKASKAGCGGL